MPELPEVETVRRGLEPALTGARFQRVELRRPDLRFPFPDRLSERLEGETVLSVGRRAKFLTFPLSSGELLTAHLGMTGRFSVLDGNKALEPGAFYDPAPVSGHEHVVLHLVGPQGTPVRVTYSDPRRFGFFELFRADEVHDADRFANLGPEPLSEAFNAEALRGRLQGKAAPLKAALLDQKVVAGLGNIYVCEVLHRTGLHPTRTPARTSAARIGALVPEIRAVLTEAIEAGGSSLRDHRQADGELGYFQHTFRVYDREDAPCPRDGCGGTIRRIVQSGRSTFFCPGCQR